jgi:hypothetical protein
MSRWGKLHQTLEITEILRDISLNVILLFRYFVLFSLLCTLYFMDYIALGSVYLVCLFHVVEERKPAGLLQFFFDFGVLSIECCLSTSSCMILFVTVRCRMINCRLVLVSVYGSSSVGIEPSTLSMRAQCPGLLQFFVEIF